MSIAAGSFASAAFSRAGDTGIAAAAAVKPSAATLSGCPAAGSRATREPMEWAPIIALRAPAARNSAAEEDEGGQRGIEVAAAGAGKDFCAVDDEPHGSRLLRGAQRLGEILDDVARGLEPDRDAHQLLAQAGGLELRRVHLLVRGARRMDPQGLGVADVGEGAREPQAFDELFSRRAPALDAAADDRTRAPGQQ